MKTSLFSNSFLLFLAFIVTSTLSVVRAQPSLDYRHIDKYASHAPKEITKDIARLTNYLCEPANNDYERVRAFYTWISHNIRYDRRKINDNNYYYNFNSTEVLEKRKGVCTGFAHLFRDMCHQAGILSEVVSGYSRQTPSSSNKHIRSNHAWNAVYIDSLWYLIDVTWAQGLSKQQSLSTEFFLSSPQHFIKTHLPSVQMWQLLDCPISVSQFKMRASRVQAHLDSVSVCYNYVDTIKNYLALSPPDRRLHRDRHIYKFNPTSENGDLLGHALVDYAGVIIDSLELIQSSTAQDSTSSNQITNGYRTVVDILAQADAYCEFYPWQAELYFTSLINLSIGLSQSTDISVEEKGTLLERIIVLLDTAIDLSSREALKNNGVQLSQQALYYKKEISQALSN